MKLDNMILTDFAAAIISPPNSNGEQTTRATVISVDENDDKLVTIRLDGSDEDTAATTMVKCEEDDRVMVLLKGHKATVIGNISSPVLKKVTANDIEAGAVTASAITTQNIESDNENSWINLHLGTFNFGEKLIWNGSDLTVKGTITAGSGSKIGPWNISNDSIWYGATEAYDTADRLYFGKQGISLGSTFKVSSAGVLNATGATISGTVTAANGNIGGWDISTHNIHSTNSSGNYVYLNDGSGTNQDVLVVRTGAGTAASPYDYPVWIRANGAFKAYNADIKGSITATSGSFGGFNIESTGIRRTTGNTATFIGSGQVNLFNTPSINTSISYNEINLINNSVASNPTSTSITPSMISTTGLIREYGQDLSSRYLSKAGGTLNGGLTVNGLITTDNAHVRSAHATDAHTYAWNTTTTCYASCRSQSDGNHGLYSNGYWNGSAFVSDGRYLIRRSTSNNTVVPSELYTYNEGYTALRPVVGTNAGTNAVGVIVSNSASFGIYGRWAGGATAAMSGRTISCPASDIRLKENVEDSTVDALSVINAIRMRQFDWKDPSRGHWDCGMIVDEMEKDVDPKFCIGGEDTKDGTVSYKSVDTFYLQGYEVKAIQELSARVEELERRLNERGN